MAPQVYGGGYDAGTVFELVPEAGGEWREKVLYSFGYNGDGAYPFASLVFDTVGNLYGTTAGGGAYSGGTVVELMPRTDGGWREKVLHSFNGNTIWDGYSPYAGLVFDANGNLYGTTYYGGTGKCGDGYGVGCGIVFELIPNARRGWTEKVLHYFTHGKDGYFPNAGLILDGYGNLYSTAAFGGGGTCENGEGQVAGCGTVYELTPKADGRWTEKLLHIFNNNGKDGTRPLAALTIDGSGNLFGTTDQGGSVGCSSEGYVYGCGTVFELTPEADGTWSESVLHSFCSFTDCDDGDGPIAGLIFDTVGNLYGTTTDGGGSYPYGVGTAFELTSKEGGGWTEKVLHRFDSDDKDGDWPQAGLVFDAAGNLYGTTWTGGITCAGDGAGCGTVFKITP